MNIQDPTLFRPQCHVGGARADADGLARITTIEQGKPLAKGEAVSAARFIELLMEA